MTDFKEKLRKEWKYHKSSHFIFFYGVFLFFIFVVFSVLVLRTKFEAPNFLISGLVLINSGWIVFHIFSDISDEQRKSEKNE